MEIRFDRSSHRDQRCQRKAHLSQRNVVPNPRKIQPCPDPKPDLNPTILHVSLESTHYGPARLLMLALSVAKSFEAQTIELTNWIARVHRYPISLTKCPILCASVP